MLATFSNIEGLFEQYGLDGAERIVVLACYAPLLLWGPLLGAVTVSYARRTGVGRPWCQTGGTSSTKTTFTSE